MDDKPLIQLNEEQQKAVYCEENAVVAAGAGSGKTSVLASRYAYLVTEKNYQVDQILTLTFTRKAAAEMYQRIYSTLSYIAVNEKGIKQKRARDAVNDFFHARIQTLDSYSASIVKQASSRYGIRPDFAVDEERCQGIAEEEALPFLIARRHHPAIRKLYRRKGPAKLAEDIFAATVSRYSHIDEPPDFIADIKKQFVLVCGEWTKATGLITAKLQELVQFISDYEEEDKFLNTLKPLLKPFKTGKIQFPKETELRSYFDSLLLLPDTECIDNAEKAPIQKTLFQNLEYIYRLKAVSLQGGKKTVQSAKDMIRDIRSLFGTFSSLAVFSMQAGIVLSLMSLLNDFQKIYLDKKRAEGALTFTDVARLARSILINHTDIRDNEKTAFRAIMIDEFQDNNALQKDLLFLLAEKSDRKERSVPRAADISPGKLFFVGDEKQSIYRFRGADVSVFRRLQEELNAAALPLSTNYRSSPALIGAFNALFGGSEFDPAGEKPLGLYDAVFVPESPQNEAVNQTADSSEKNNGIPLPPYEAIYTPLRAGREEPGKISICILDKGAEAADDNEDGDDEQLHSDENEAIFAAERIREILGEGKYSPDDIAILFRAHGPQKVFEKHLRLLNIPYTSEGISGFFSDGPVNDMLAALRLIAYPLDTEAYAVMLRSPFVGLSMRGLALCLAQYHQAKSETGEAPQPFSEAVIPLLGEEDRSLFVQGGKLYQRLCEKAAQSSISDLVSQLWYTEGYRYETEWNSQTAVYRELYDYLFNLAVKADEETMSLAGFTDRLRSLQESGERLEDMDIPLERSGAVRLMTIHKSKGLEFPVVFLCCCGKHGRNNGNDAEVYASDTGGLSFNPPLPPECSGMDDVKRNFFYEQGRIEEKRKQTAELRRLLYVAMTRAEKELCISGCLSFGKDNEDRGNLAERLKIAVNAKKEAKEVMEMINGDAILDNDTFFGLLLPTVADRITGGDAADQSEFPSFLNLESIPVYTEERIKSREQHGGNGLRQETVYPNNGRGRLKFLADTEPFYKRANSITTAEIINDHRTPTSFKENIQANGAGDFKTSGEFSGATSPEVFEKVDLILKRFLQKEESFSPADFGTIAHACVEALLNKRDALIPPRLGGHLSLAEVDTLLAAGKKLAERFLQSPLGRAAEAAKIRKSEYQFRSLIKNSAGKDVFINGTIDLLFADDDSVHVVDFKTDSSENPAEHVPQMAFYYRAASELMGKPCRIWLYYLRSGRAVEMTEAAKNFNISAQEFQI